MSPLNLPSTDLTYPYQKGIRLNIYTYIKLLNISSFFSFGIEILFSLEYTGYFILIIIPLFHYLSGLIVNEHTLVSTRRLHYSTS